MRPEIAEFITKEQETEIFELIGRLIQTLRADHIGIDERHTPRLHARFLASLLRKLRRDLPTSGRLQTTKPPPEPIVVPTASTSESSQVPTASSSSANASSVPSTSAKGGSQDNLATLGVQVPSGVTAAVQEPVYQEEAAYAGSGGPMEVFDFGGQDGGSQESLGLLLALQSPNYWRDMMMPGYVILCSLSPH